ncbi:hypothetical protein [Paraburkholderia sp. ZP32-5]|uniref:hypothetical protein n=1 Tax=Paraburkholderia sp. ZP32-5 TaxID=2883245 RepID=UPI001F2E3036|nr:hypothetical protein [Paraburkholderia sp. ZP32-5]
MRNLSSKPKATAADTRDEAAEICFRYRSGPRRARHYDVLMTLGDPGGTCRLAIREALPDDADLPPLTSGRVNATRLMRALDLIGLVERITSQDNAPSEPGRLLYDAHLHMPQHAARDETRRPFAALHPWPD